MSAPLRMRSLKAGDLFRFSALIGGTFEYRGNGWYGSPGGYDGGPWHAHEDHLVVRIETEASDA